MKLYCQAGWGSEICPHRAKYAVLLHDKAYVACGTHHKSRYLEMQVRGKSPLDPATLPAAMQVQLLAQARDAHERNERNLVAYLAAYEQALAAREGLATAVRRYQALVSEERA